MSNWNNVEKLEGAPSETYDESTITYDDADYNYIGQIKENWSNVTKN